MNDTPITVTRSISRQQAEEALCIVNEYLKQHAETILEKHPGKAVYDKSGYMHMTYTYTIDPYDLPVDTPKPAAGDEKHER